MLRRFPNLFFYFIILASSGLSETLFSSERTLEYKSTLKVEVNGKLEVTEEIIIIAKGRKIKRGIYRDFPTTYKDKAGNRVRVDFIVKEVLRDGLPKPYTILNKSNGKRGRIGSNNVFLSLGKHIYTLKYQTNRQIGFFKEYDEIYFNAIKIIYVISILRKYKLD